MIPMRTASSGGRTILGAALLALMLVRSAGAAVFDPGLRPFLDDRQIAGAVVLVADAEKVLHVGGIGYADVATKRKMAPDALFWIASMTKPITCTALMMLVDEGKVNVDAAVSKYLPEFRDQWLIVERDDAHQLLRKPAQPMRVRDLMSHTSGITKNLNFHGVPGGDDLPLNIRVAAYAAQPLESEPGTKYHYTNGGMAAVGRLVERVSGLPYGEFLQKRLFDPLGMKDTSFWPTDAQVARLATGYRGTKDGAGLEPAPLDPFRYPLSDRTRHPMPGGGLFSTAADLAKFCQMILNQGTYGGRRYLSPALVKQMTSRQTADGIPESYGFGWTTNGGMVAHAGAWKTNMTVHPQAGLITIFLVQNAGWRTDEGKKAEPAFRKAALAAFGKTATAAVPPPSEPASPPAFSATKPPTLAVSKEHITVFNEPGLYGGWPANHGIWQWGDEIVVGFTVATYQHQVNAHAVDRSVPFQEKQARSLDGGRTWTLESDLPFREPAKAPKPQRLTEPLDFTAPNFAFLFRFGSIHVGPSWFYTSTDRCKTWRGPYAFSVDGIDRIATRTDLVVLGPRDCLMFGSAAKADGKEGRPFCARTTDGGLTWKLVLRIGPEPAGFAIMPSSLRLKNGVILTTVRRTDPGDSFIEAWRSPDQGAHWDSTGKAAVNLGGGPPSLVQLPDGRVALTYGFRAKPHGARARISADGGYTWGSEIVLRDDGFTGDLGYARSVVRPDGKVLTVYYFNGPRDEDRPIEATLWTPPTAAAEAELHRPALSPMTNGTEWKADRPVALKNPQRPRMETAFLYQPSTEWTYSHHQSITFFKGRFYAIWSNGRVGEDLPGQRVLMASSADFRTWTRPRPLVDSVTDEKGVERVLTAGGFHQHSGTLVAYFGNYGPNKETTHLQAVTTTDGEHWSAVREIGIPFCPNQGPERISTGRLIFAGNTAFPYTDDPSGLTGWKMTGIYPVEMAAKFEDDPMTFGEVAMRQGWPSSLCEGSFFETDDHVLHMQLRNVSRAFFGRLWTTESRDNGVTWSKPALTSFSDWSTKFHFGRLPDGRFYHVGNPLAGSRIPLVLHLSRDGVNFDRHFILGDTPYQRLKEGGSKGGEYGYPHTLVHDGYLYTIVSRQKEAVQVLRVALSELRE
ncbi:MAG: hypothetical protein EXS37_03085 [Opitutus sp.]|nr:hypothetical protein [Opitutus sp.]